MSSINTTNTYNPLSQSTKGEVIMVIIIVIFLFFIITLILYIRAKHYPGIIGVSNTLPHHVFVTSHSSPLDPSVLTSLPIAVFRSQDFKEEGGLECAVCLSEFRDGENARVLPKCKHGFHVECIDMWFASNSTCPLCRLPVAPATTVNIAVDTDLRQILVTNFGEASSSTNAESLSEKEAKGMVAIEIPESVAGNCSSIRACNAEQGAAGEKS